MAGTSTVFFTDMRSTSPKDNLLKKVRALFDRAGFNSLIKEGELVALKIHFGQRGNLAYTHPVLARQVVDKVKERGGKPFLVDTNTLYSGGRQNSVDHLQTALENGFSYATVQAPLVIADGLWGNNFYQVEVKQKHFDTVKIASDIYNAPAMLVLSHFKGHELSGFGGAIKNLAMGCSNRGGKQVMHSVMKPRVDREQCTGCGNCVKWCPVGALGLGGDQVALLDQEKCLGCGECSASCRYRAIRIRWETSYEDFQERMVEFALGAVQNKRHKTGYFNFVMNVTPECDCKGWSDAPIVPDAGIMASLDPVALDQASLDMVNRQVGLPGSGLETNFAPGQDKLRGVWAEIDHTAQLEYAQEIGLGSREYQLVEIKL